MTKHAVVDKPFARYCSKIDAGNDLIEALSQRLEIGGKSNHPLERHAKRLTPGTQFGAALEQSVDLALFRCRRHPGVQICMFFRDHSCEKFCVHTISLATHPDTLGIMAGVLGI